MLDLSKTLFIVCVCTGRALLFALNNSALVKPTENRHKICLLLQVGLGDVEAFIIMIVMGNLMQ